jgi:hypothetical protein
MLLNIVMFFHCFIYWSQGQCPNGTEMSFDEDRKTNKMQQLDVYY